MSQSILSFRKKKHFHITRQSQFGMQEGQRDIFVLCISCGFFSMIIFALQNVILKEKHVVGVIDYQHSERLSYLGEGEDAGAGGNSKLLLQVLGVSPGFLEWQPGNKAIH